MSEPKPIDFYKIFCIKHNFWIRSCEFKWILVHKEYLKYYMYIYEALSSFWGQQAANRQLEMDK